MRNCGRAYNPQQLVRQIGDAMLTEAEGIVDSYRCDLVADILKLNEVVTEHFMSRDNPENATVSIAWAIRDTGTDMQEDTDSLTMRHLHKRNDKVFVVGFQGLAWTICEHFAV